mgnify:CR=1 FL=1
MTLLEKIKTDYEQYLEANWTKEGKPKGHETTDEEFAANLRKFSEGDTYRLSPYGHCLPSQVETLKRLGYNVENKPLAIPENLI